ncbi:hypothetical protein BJY01DRAFT_209115 [Aspergillus pseudoustus]|uniref:Uncharacterized protein n=1 Tax=Aspergillus pseudoustus TaxID=1810923 RepID=A0ABR4KGU2_9EURO
MVWALRRLTWESELFDPPSGTVLARLTIDSPTVRLWVPDERSTTVNGAVID